MSSDKDLADRASQTFSSWPQHYRLIFMGMSFIATDRGTKPMTYDLFLTLTNDLEKILLEMDEVEKCLIQ